MPHSEYEKAQNNGTGFGILACTALSHWNVSTLWSVNRSTAFLCNRVRQIKDITNEVTHERNDLCATFDATQRNSNRKYHDKHDYKTYCTTLIIDCESLFFNYQLH